MKQDIKISLPYYKLFYAFAFVVLIALARGVSSFIEVGITLEAYIPLLACVFCADTCYQEIQEGRWEILTLFPNKRQAKAIRQRLLLQYLFLFILSGIGFGLFCLFQHPVIYSEHTESLWGGESSLVIMLFLQTMLAVAIGIAFFAGLTVTIVRYLGNLWGGIGIVVLFWVQTSSLSAQKLPMALRLFTLSEVDLDHPEDISWMMGKLIMLLLAVLFLLLQNKVGTKKVPTRRRAA